MKKLVVIANVALVLLSSCATQKMGNYTDDVYANPKEDRVIEARLAAERKQAQDAADKRYNDSIAAVKRAQKEKDDANPYYKDREFKYDDYYDYEYATRIKRFNNNINGLSYYDNYYTNSYWYNQNPYNYGVSIYNGYSWWGPSYNYYSYNPSITFYSNWGWGCSPGYGYYSGYNPYMAGYAAGYNNGFYNGMYGNYYGYGSPYPYSAYGNYFGYGASFGYGYGYPYGYGYSPYYGYNPYNTWGYYNSYDHNSSYTYGPRSAHGGGNSRRTSNPGINGKRDSYYEKYVDAVADQQNRSEKFSNPVRNNTNSFDDPIRVNNNGAPVGTGGVKQPHSTRNNDIPTRSDNPVRNSDVPVRGNPNFGYDSNNNPVRQQDVPNTRAPQNGNVPVRQNPVGNTEPVRNSEPVRQQQVNPNPRLETPGGFNNSNFPSNGGGGGGNSTPSNNGGGHRPR